MSLRKILMLLGLFLGIYQAKSQENKQIYINDDIQIEQLSDSIFRHITWEESNQFGRFSSNGMLIIHKGQAIMIDTPFDNEKTEIIVNYLRDSMHVELIKLISGHFHLDCIGGLEYIQSQGIESIASNHTVNKCTELGLPVPSTPFKDELIVDLNGLKLVCRYFGGGHTPDNIVVWIPRYKILFGGCLIKSGNAISLGFTGDSDMTNYDLTIEKIIEEYPEIEKVVPGHGDVGGINLLSHTIDLVKNKKALEK
jgi:metallo-beta-lactamase class B